MYKGCKQLVVICSGIPELCSAITSSSNVPCFTELHNQLKLSPQPNAHSEDELRFYHVDLAGLAAPACFSSPAQLPLPEVVFVAGDCTSSFELAWYLEAQNLLPEWGSVIVHGQSRGRGQMLRPWQSLPGNLFITLKLPSGKLFSGDSASVLTGHLFVEAFKKLGFDLKLKWPNDLVLVGAEGVGKVGGILLEQKGMTTMAGVGINCISCPDAELLRKDAAMPASFLAKNLEPISPLGLWLTLVPYLKLVYDKSILNVLPEAENSIHYRPEWLTAAERNLLWLGQRVTVNESHESSSLSAGVITGLSTGGGLLLHPDTNGCAAANNELEIYSGSISLCRR